MIDNSSIKYNGYTIIKEVKYWIPELDEETIVLNDAKKMIDKTQFSKNKEALE